MATPDITFPNMNTPLSFNLSITGILKFLDSDLLGGYTVSKISNNQGPVYQLHIFLSIGFATLIPFNPEIGKKITLFWMSKIPFKNEESSSTMKSYLYLFQFTDN